MSRTGTTTSDRARGGRPGGQPGDAPSPVTSLRSRRRRSRRHVDPRRRLLIALAVTALLVGAIAWVVLGSSLLAVRTVQVDGTRGLSDQVVVEAARIAVGTPLVRVDTAAAAARVADLPQVASVEVTRGWPRTVVVTVVERTPVAVVTDGGTRRLVDAKGMVFDTITGDPPAGVVPLDVADPGPDDAATTAALGALTALPGDVRAQVTGVAARTGDDVTLTLTDGRSVLWGSAAQTERKADVLGAVLAQIESGALDPAGTVDVSTPDSVVLR
ncbi:MAG TPA: FtsQ-type POTRA domain-containing protein [Modestobacter sp.]|nr:FtsQ-type POTRA domain-containing protein [Modestobacter sp.]